MDNPEKLATYGTQDEDKQSKNTTQYVLDTDIHKQARVQPLFSLGSCCSSFSSVCGGLRVIVCLVVAGFYSLWAIMLYILQLRATDYPSNLSWFVLVKYNILFLEYLEKATLQNIE
jgi:hypothetical protein